jgi:hypothetical protein
MPKGSQQVTSTSEDDLNVIYVGGEKKLSCSGDENLKEKTKEFRIRIGTLLKTDNVSFLLGAGCSIRCGGLTLAEIPYKIEKGLHEEGYKGNGAAKWLKIFYRCVSVCAGELLMDEPDARRKRVLEFLASEPLDVKLRNNSIKKGVMSVSSIKDYEKLQFKDLYTYTIPINLEYFLARLYSWANGAIDGYVSFRFDTKPQNAIPTETIFEIISKIKKSLVKHCKLPVQGHSIDSHRKFIKKILTRPLNLRRVNLFTLNYDTLLEQACDSEGTVIIDGFVGNLRRIFRPESFEQDLYFPAETTEGKVHRLDRVLHLYKLHGSLNWSRAEPSWENPYGLYATAHEQVIPEQDVIIYPTPLKYGEMLGFPYSELFRRFANIIVRPQSVLFVIGYSFGDEHINVLIRQALTIPSFTLVIVDPKPKNALVEMLLAQKDQRVTIMKGWEIGTFEGFVEHLLPDLREDEIQEKVIKTYNALIKKLSQDGPHEDEG